MQSQNRTFSFSIHIAHNAYRLFVYIFMNEFSSKNIISELLTLFCFFLRANETSTYRMASIYSDHGLDLCLKRKNKKRSKNSTDKNHLRRDEMRLYG